MSKQSSSDRFNSAVTHFMGKAKTEINKTDWDGLSKPNQIDVARALVVLSANDGRALWAACCHLFGAHHAGLIKGAWQDAVDCEGGDWDERSHRSE